MKKRRIPALLLLLSLQHDKHCHRNSNGKSDRLDYLNKFGYYVTESSEHNAEYNPFYIKSNYPELIEKFNIPIDELTPDPNNAKAHPDWQIEQIAASIEQFGFDDPVGVWHDADGRPVIVEGHGRVLAAKELGIEPLEGYQPIG